MTPADRFNELLVVISLLTTPKRVCHLATEHAKFLPDSEIIPCLEFIRVNSKQPVSFIMQMWTIALQLEKLKRKL